jgi:hypothetical protein
MIQGFHSAALHEERARHLDDYFNKDSMSTHVVVACPGNDQGQGIHPTLQLKSTMTRQTAITAKLSDR